MNDKDKQTGRILVLTALEMTAKKLMEAHEMTHLIAAAGKKLNDTTLVDDMISLCDSFNQLVDKLDKICEQNALRWDNEAAEAAEAAADTMDADQFWRAMGGRNE